MLIPKDESEDEQYVNTSPAIQHQIPIQNSSSFEEISSVTHTESFSVENTAFSPVSNT